MSTCHGREDTAPAAAPIISEQNIFLITLVASTFLMGSSFIAGKTLLQDGFGPLVLVGWRCFAAAMAAAPLVRLDGPYREAFLPPQVGVREATLMTLIGLLQTTGVMGFLFLSMQYISASASAIMLFTNPIWVAMLGLLFLGETLHTWRVIGLLLGLVGIIFAIGVGPELSSNPDSVLGEIFGLCSAFCWAAATIINKRAKLPFGGWAISFWQLFIGSLGLLAIAYASGEHWPENVTAEQWAWFFWLAIPATTGSFGLWFVALRNGGATRTSGYLFLTPLFAVILSFIILGTTLTWLQATGGILICVALWLINSRRPDARVRERQNA